MTTKRNDKNCRCKKSRNSFSPRIPSWKVGKKKRWERETGTDRINKIEAEERARELATYAEEKLIQRKKLLKAKTEIIQHYTQGKMKCMKCSENALELLLPSLSSKESEHSHKIGLKWHEFCCITDLFEKKRDGRVSFTGVAFYYRIINAGFPESIKILCFNCDRLAYLDILEKKQVKHPKQRESRLKLKLEILSKYSDKKTPQCICCGVENIRVLELDHILSKSNYPIQRLGYNIDTNQLKSLIKKQEHECIVCNKELNINGDEIQCEDEKLHQDDAKLMKKVERQKMRIIKEKQHINSIKKTHRVTRITSNEPLATSSLFYFLKKNNFPKANYQILCKNCNISKSDKSDCCHKRK